jgi:PGAP1-like protein.
VTLGGLIETVADVPPLDAYGSIAILAHSMGGLLAQRALLSSDALRKRVSHLLLFGTPSNGLEKASPFHFWKRQIRDMATGSPFITTLRGDWTTTIGTTPPFTFVTVAGDKDEFVPRTSSIEPFPEPRRRVAYGNHLEIVKPPDAEHLGYKIALKALTGTGPPAVPWILLASPSSHDISRRRSIRSGRIAPTSTTSRWSPSRWRSNLWDARAMPSTC